MQSKIQSKRWQERIVDTPVCPNNSSRPQATKGASATLWWSWEDFEWIENTNFSVWKSNTYTLVFHLLLWRTNGIPANCSSVSFDNLLKAQNQKTLNKPPQLSLFWYEQRACQKRLLYKKVEIMNLYTKPDCGQTSPSSLCKISWADFWNTSP